MLRRLLTMGRPTGPGRHPSSPFTRELGDHRLQYEPGGPTLVVSFDNAARPAEEAYVGRPTWGARFYLSEGHSLLGVIARETSWYRDRTLIAALEALRDEGFFASFARVVLTGGSMGGFAAAAFAPLAPGATVIAFSPQSTLDGRVVPWERRYANGRARDWTLPYSDGPAGLAEAAQGFVFFDNLDRADLRHAARFEQTGRVQLMPIPAGGHGVPPMLIQTGLLKPLTRQIIDGSFAKPAFQKAIRARKETIRYHRMLAREALMRRRPGLALRVCDAGLKRFPLSDLLETRSLALAAMDRPQQALAALDRARALRDKRRG